jgi:hypothetical protein
MLPPARKLWGLFCFVLGQRVHAVANGTVTQRAELVYHNPPSPIHVVQVCALQRRACEPAAMRQPCGTLLYIA